MKKNGFTLIELLAVIVILAIIALIATPAVLNILEDSKKSAAERSTEAAVKAGEIHYMSEIAKGNTVTNPLEITAANLKVDNKPSTGTVTVTVSADGQTVTVTATDLVFDTYTCDYNKTDGAVCTKN